VVAGGRGWRVLGDFGVSISYADVRGATGAELGRAI